MEWFYMLLAIVAGYIMGAIPFGFLFVKLAKGIDLRDVGSGRTGATNSMRAAGPAMFILTFLMDVFKGFAAVWLARWIAGGTVPAAWLPWAEALAGAASVIGHNWSIFLKFGGGAGTGPNVGWVDGHLVADDLDHLPLWRADALLHGHGLGRIPGRRRGHSHRLRHPLLGRL